MKFPCLVGRIVKIIFHYSANSAEFCIFSFIILHTLQKITQISRQNSAFYAKQWNITYKFLYTAKKNGIWLSQHGRSNHKTEGIIDMKPKMTSIKLKMTSQKPNMTSILPKKAFTKLEDNKHLEDVGLDNNYWNYLLISSCTAKAGWCDWK